MVGKKTLYRITEFTLLLLLALVATTFSIVAAQDDETPVLGVSIAEDENGALVHTVYPNSPAADAGLEFGDVITAVDGETVTAERLAEVIHSHAVGDVVTLTILRDGETLELEATLDEYHFPIEVAIVPEIFGEEQPYLGVGIEADDGVVVAEIVEDSAAAEAGLQEGDIITTLDDAEIANYDELRSAVLDHEIGDAVTIGILRDGEAMTLEAELGSSPEVHIERHFEPGRHLDDFEFDFGGVLALTFEDGNLIIGRLSEDSPLYEAGLREGDVITAINGEPLDSLNFFGMHQHRQHVEEDATVTVERDGETLDIAIPVDALGRGMFRGDFGTDFSFGEHLEEHFDEEFPFSEFEGHLDPFAFVHGGVRLGVTYITLDEQTAQEYDAPATEGAYIIGVEPDSPADAAGLQEGDVVVAVDGDAVDFEHSLADRMYAYEPGDTVTLDVQRDGESIQIEVTLGSPIESASLAPFGETLGAIVRRGHNILGEGSGFFSRHGEFPFGGNFRGNLRFFAPHFETEPPDA